MVKKKKCAVIIFVFMAIILTFVGCSSAESDDSSSGTETDLTGVWILDDEFSSSGVRIPKTLEFFSDGTVQSSWGGNYTIDGDRMNISYSAMDSYSYTFSISDDELILKSAGGYSTDSTEYKYTRSGSETDSKPSLADSCDEILAEGTNDNGDTYQLVLNYSDTVDGNESVGVIKNDEWLIDLSENPEPAIKDDLFYSGKGKIFVLNNSFRVGKYIWNVETKKIFTMDDNVSALLSYVDYSQNYSPESMDIVGENKFVVCKNQNSEEIYYLVNEETMKIEKKLKTGFSYGPYSEGLIYGENSNGEQGFYNESGDQIINLDKYYVGETPVFINGKSIIYTYSDSGAVQHMTIDKQGNILSIE